MSIFSSSSYLLVLHSTQQAHSTEYWLSIDSIKPFLPTVISLPSCYYFICPPLFFGMYKVLAIDSDPFCKEFCLSLDLLLFLISSFFLLFLEDGKCLGEGQFEDIPYYPSIAFSVCMAQFNFRCLASLTSVLHTKTRVIF